MRRLMIAVDCDDVLVRTTPFFIDAYNAKYDTNVTLEKAYESEASWGTTREILDGRFGELMLTDEYKKLSPSDEEVTVLGELAKTHELHVITARRPHERPQTQATLDSYFPGVFDSLELVGFHGSKGEVTERLQADVMIDDNPKHLEDAIKHGLPPAGAILFGDYPWNNAAAGMTKCLTWEEVKKEIDRLAAAR